MALFKSGYVAVVGRPNVGKSTLLNAFLGQKVAAVSPRPQTTRRRQLGILTQENAQLIFIDTPGMHQPKHKLGEFMVAEAAAALQDADVIVFLVDVSSYPEAEDHLLADQIMALSSRISPVILALNKADLVASADMPARQAAYLALAPQALPLVLSGLTWFQRDLLLETIIHYLPDGVSFYDADQVTDFYERDIAADFLREAALIHLRDEVPHCIAVRIDEYKERKETGAFIAATLFVERDSQKGIVIGQGGEMLKAIGASARQEIEKMSGRKVYLELRVKVQKNWRNNEDALRLLGLTRDQEG